MVSQDILARAMVWMGTNNDKGGGYDKWLPKSFEGAEDP